MTWGAWYWPVALVFCAVVIFIPEAFALMRNPKNTLSNWVWQATGTMRGTPITSWTAAHFLIGGLLVLGAVWIIGHLVFHWWT